MSDGSRPVAEPPDPDDYGAILGSLEGSGIREDPYVVTDVVELQAVDGAPASHYRLGCDIDASPTEEWAVDRERSGVGSHLVSMGVLEELPDGSGFAPIGDDGFSGSFDGDGHEISGLYVEQPYDGVGLFARLSSGTVRDLTLCDVDVTGTGDVGGVAGVNEGVVDGVVVDGSVAGSGTAAGGLVGRNDGVVGDSRAECAVDGSFRAGGLVGSNEGEIRGSSAGGSVSGVNAVGGLVGRAEGEIEDCSASGTVSGESYVGGLVGAVDGRLARVSADGEVTGEEYVGGLMGVNHAYPTGCSASGTVSGETSVGGVAGKNTTSLSWVETAGSVSGTEAVGGLVGTNTGSVQGCEIDATVSGASRVGGIAGTNEDEVDDSTVEGEVTGAEAVGGLVGRNVATVTDCSTDASVSGAESVGEFVGVDVGQTVNCTGTGFATVDSVDVDTDDTESAESTVPPDSHALLQRRPDRTFADVGGMDDLIATLEERVIDPLRQPDRYREYELGTVDGVLLHGPPGCGKTFVAGALAAEAGYNFIAAEPSAITSKWVGEAADNVAELFDVARASAPCLVFLDEIDAIASDRSGQMTNSEQQMVNQLLTELDADDDAVVVVAATNYVADIDDAILRSGRFDERIEVPPPDADARREILELELEGRPTADDLDLADTVERTAGYASSDVVLVADLAARFALEGEEPVTADHLRRAVAETETSLHGWLDRYDWLVPDDDGVADRSDATAGAPGDRSGDDGDRSGDTAVVSGDRSADGEAGGAAAPVPDVTGSPSAETTADPDQRDGPAVEPHRAVEDFDALPGLEGAVDPLRSRVVDPVASPEAYAEVGVDPPDGVLLYGPAGAGKTTLAHAVAAELDRPLFELSPDRLLGSGADPDETVLATVEAARVAGPSVLCLDGLEDLLPDDGDGPEDGGATLARTLVATLSDAVADEVLVVATATDPADLRQDVLYTDWIDDRIEVGPPGPEGRRAILSSKLPAEAVADSLDWARVIEATDGLVAGDLAALADTAVRDAVGSSSVVDTADLVAAADSFSP